MSSQINMPGVARDFTVAPDGAAGDEWYTPQWLLDLLGPIDLDPCWSPDSLVKSERVISKAAGNDGLADRWIRTGCEVVFCNPPFSNASKWLAKASEEGDHKPRWSVRQVVVVLVPAYPGDGPWDRCVWPSARFVGWIRGRMTFRNPDGVSEQKGRGHGLVVFGPDRAECARWVAAVADRDTEGRIIWTVPIGDGSGYGYGDGGSDTRQEVAA